MFELCGHFVLIPRCSLLCVFILFSLRALFVLFALRQAVVIPDARKKVQKDVDNAIISKLDKLTSGYLGARFTLSKGEFPHQLKF